MSKDNSDLVKAGGWTFNCDPVPTTAAEVEEIRAEFRERQDTIRSGLLSIADKLEKGDALNSLEQAVAASVIRNAAANLPTEPKIKRGRPGTLPHMIMIEYATLVIRDGLSRTAAVQYIAEKYKASVNAVKKKLKSQGADNFIASAQRGSIGFVPKAGPV